MKIALKIFCALNFNNFHLHNYSTTFFLTKRSKTDNIPQYVMSFVRKIVVLSFEINFNKGVFVKKKITCFDPSKL